MAAIDMLSSEVHDARTAMRALIDSRALSTVEQDPGFAKQVAKLAWAIADAMAAERIARQRGRGK